MVWVKTSVSAAGWHPVLGMQQEQPRQGQALPPGTLALLHAAVAHSAFKAAEAMISPLCGVALKK